MAFIELDIINLAFVEEKFAKFATEMPQMLITIPKLVGKSMMDVLVMPSIKQNTPVDTGELKSQTDWHVVENDVEHTRIQVFSTAQNTRSGYEYARARAYGFTTRSGSRWEPPEQPPYPVAGFQEANVGNMGAIMPMGDIMRIVPL